MVQKILRVDMENREIEYESVPEEYKSLGGRGLTSKIVSDEVPPKCHPLGPNNKLVIAPGIVTGTNAPSSGRLSAGGKSPLTGGIKEANAGTSFAQMLGRLGIKAIIVEGQSENGYQLLSINNDGAELNDAEQWSGRGLYEAYEDIRNEFGEDVGICGAGVSAELNGMNSGLAFNDIEGRPSRYAGRGGLGAVMASRGLKFIVLNQKGAPGVEIEDKETFEEGRKKLEKALGKHDVTKPEGTLNTYGTDALINVINEAGALPQRNFSDGRDDESAKVSGEEKAKQIEKRGGERPHMCSPGCVIQCSEVWTKPDGEDPVGVLEYESVWALGPNCGIYDLEIIGELNRACNDLGVDTIEMGNTIAVAMEGGLADFGDGERAMELIEEIGEGTSLGKVLANGTEHTARTLGVSRVPTVKGQAMPAYDPRAIKGIGVTYATTPMGADHTAGYAVATEIMGVGGEADPLEKSGKAELSRNLQRSTAVIDTAGYCLFTAFAVMDIPEGLEGMVETVNGVLGTDLTTEDVPELGKQVLETEREFNKEAGFSNADDRLPEFMREEKLPPHNEVFDVPEEDLDSVFS
ncbi:aldehyde:ferredoxin oxidoreductase [candidate division MSBL1 archaeon SCGC-AAA259O05]|uniref:Aldehyde:ferredoxin oxidoreductase n=1 Tax=candidate division MSBL1 archaeon SCGC-AAA259O05 TaxID=1698271 RepID=A0A133V2W4_9EURY|nr:aldehyde:ferredoxin oxidoreductase [candidate division MSBL1 archaeon SCGC-AAA259O05]